MSLGKWQGCRLWQWTETVWENSQNPEGARTQTDKNSANRVRVCVCACAPVCVYVTATSVTLMSKVLQGGSVRLGELNEVCSMPACASKLLSHSSAP